jgi:glycosyl transferase family 25
MKIYVINLASSTQRMQAISEHLHSLGLAFERVEAVWGKDLSERELANLYSPQANHQRFYRPLSAGEIGCYASHLNVWRAMVDGCVPLALVLEDDMELDARMPVLLQAMEAMEATQAWDMVKLVGMRPAEAARKWPFIEGFDWVDCKRLPSQTGAYVIRLSGATKLARRAAPFSRPIDVELRHHWEFDLKVLALSPYPAREAPTAQLTTIGFSRRLSAGQRLRKWRYQLAYSFHNAWHRWRHGGHNLQSS